MGKRTNMERGMRNRRYRRTEDKILRVFFVENKKGTTLSKMARKAGVARATMYAHHHAIREVIPDYRQYMLVEYDKLMRRKLRKKKVSLRALYLDTLLFILRNKKVFKMLIEFGDMEILMRILKRIKPKVISSIRLPKGSEKVFRVYVSEVTEIIVEWSEGGFSEIKMNETLSNIMYLTNTARDRLMPIN